MAVNVFFQKFGSDFSALENVNIMLAGIIGVWLISFNVIVPIWTNGKRNFHFQRRLAEYEHVHLFSNTNRIYTFTNKLEHRQCWRCQIRIIGKNRKLAIQTEIRLIGNNDEKWPNRKLYKYFFCLIGNYKNIFFV